jgi:hypothetical protein
LQKRLPGLHAIAGGTGIFNGSGKAYYYNEGLLNKAKNQ